MPIVDLFMYVYLFPFLFKQKAVFLNETPHFRHFLLRKLPWNGD